MGIKLWLFQVPIPKFTSEAEQFQIKSEVHNMTTLLTKNGCFEEKDAQSERGLSLQLTPFDIYQFVKATSYLFNNNVRIDKTKVREN